jgi:hypothetical protein
MNFLITPHADVGAVQFGMVRSVIHTLFVEAPEQFFRGDTEDTDYYLSHGLFVLYDAAEICVALEFTRPARVLLDGIALLELPKKEAVARFKADPNFEQDASGYTCYQLGIGAYYERPKQAETVIAFWGCARVRTEIPGRPLRVLEFSA